MAADRVRHSSLQHIREISKPSVPGYGIDEAFQESDQRYFHLCCPECGEYTCMDPPSRLVDACRARADGYFTCSGRCRMGKAGAKILPRLRPLPRAVGHVKGQMGARKSRINGQGLSHIGTLYTDMLPTSRGPSRRDHGDSRRCVHDTRAKTMRSHPFSHSPTVVARMKSRMIFIREPQVSTGSGRGMARISGWIRRYFTCRGL